MGKIFGKSDSFNSEYCCSIIRIGEVKPIEGKDRIGHTIVNGESVVVRKDQVKEGCVMIYASNETQLNKDFLSANNLFEKSSFELNSNAHIVKPFIDNLENNKLEISSFIKKSSRLNKFKTTLEQYETQKLLAEQTGDDKVKESVEDDRINARKGIQHYVFGNGLTDEDTDEEHIARAVDTCMRYEYHIKELEEQNELNNESIKRNVGFFNKTGRVKMIRLGSIPSMGYLFSLEELAKYCPDVKDINIEELVGEDFDTVNGELFVKAYVPFVPERHSKSKTLKANKKIEQFDRMVKGEFSFHYDTDPLPKNIQKIEPDDVVTISVKVHGTSAIFGNLKVKTPIKLPFYKKLWNKFIDTTRLFKGLRVADYFIEYGNISASRKIIKNKYINENVSEGYYGVDIWTEYGELLYPFIDKGMTVYGEIIGYVTNSEKMIQKNYDYGCEVGKNKFMPYRITSLKDDGTKREWKVTEVKEWTEKLLRDCPELSDRIMIIDILYHGTLCNLYPEQPISQHWHENVLQLMRDDTKHFGMEKKEPLCIHKVPREGIVLRKDEDELTEAFKLKCYAFLKEEAKLMTDIEQGKEELSNEMAEAYQ